MNIPGLEINRHCFRPEGTGIVRQLKNRISLAFCMWHGFLPAGILPGLSPAFLKRAKLIRKIKVMVRLEVW